MLSIICEGHIKAKLVRFFSTPVSFFKGVVMVLVIRPSPIEAREQ